ncbi:Uncharacterised protein [Serratia marcescens]|uniref:hypothetical protein n=1 Tax=Serratia marcescens TaxID=615 RepID=UPI000744E264|nr:Uncharacterised protein [Serratia marcescens]
MQHFVERGFRQRAHVGKTGHKALKIRNDGGNLGLLQHHLGEPYLIGGFFQLPRQGLATVALIPVKHHLCELLCLHHEQRRYPAENEARLQHRVMVL